LQCCCDHGDRRGRVVRLKSRISHSDQIEQLALLLVKQTNNQGSPAYSRVGVVVDALAEFAPDIKRMFHKKKSNNT
jgi:hypothetical protein